MRKVKADAIWNEGPELIDDDGEVRELTKGDFARMTPFAELPKEQQEFLLQIKGATIRPEYPREEEVKLKLSGTVLEGLRATGTGWEGRIDQALREWLEQRKAS